MDESAEEQPENSRGSPYELEQRANAIVAELLPLREAATNKRERKQLSSRIKTARFMARWARTRAGYVVPERSEP